MIYYDVSVILDNVSIAEYSNLTFEELQNLKQKYETLNYEVEIQEEGKKHATI